MNQPKLIHIRIENIKKLTRTRKMLAHPWRNMQVHTLSGINAHFCDHPHYDLDLILFLEGNVSIVLSLIILFLFLRLP